MASLNIGDTITLTDLIEDMEMEGTVVAKITEGSTENYFVSVGVLGKVIKCDDTGKLVEG